MPAGAAPLDLDEIGGREDGAEQAKIQNIGAVIAGGHHAHRDADTGLAGPIAGPEVGRTQQVVVGEVDGAILCICDLRGHLHGEVGPVLAGKHPVSDLVEDLRELGRVILADRKDDRLSDLAADRVTQRVLKEGFAEKLVGGLGIKALFKLALLVGFLLVFTRFVNGRDNKPIFG